MTKQSLKRNTLEEHDMKKLNDYLIEVVKNSKICAGCIFNHGGICFFSYECIKNNYDFRQGGQEE